MNEETTTPTENTEVQAQTPAPTQPMNTASLRETIMQTPRKVQQIATPFWPGTDGTIAIGDVPMDVLTSLRDLAKRDASSYSAALAVAVLVNVSNGEKLFSDADRDWLKQHSSNLMPLVTKINEFFGFNTKDAVEAAKNA